jgi:hypothetical protein
MACWHTLGFIFGWQWQQRNMLSCLRDVDAFYYLVHPADLMDSRDLTPDRRHCLERAEVSLEQKLFYLEEAIKLIVNSGRKIVTMRELAIKSLPNSV